MSSALLFIYKYCSLKRLLETVSTDGFFGRIIRLELAILLGMRTEVGPGDVDLQLLDE